MVEIQRQKGSPFEKFDNEEKQRNGAITGRRLVKEECEEASVKQKRETVR